MFALARNDRFFDSLPQAAPVFFIEIPIRKGDADYDFYNIWLPFSKETGGFLLINPPNQEDDYAYCYTETNR